MNGTRSARRRPRQRWKIGALVMVGAVVLVGAAIVLAGGGLGANGPLGGTLTAPPTPTPTPAPVAATTDGVWLPASEAALATRHPIAVMIDDQFEARPQSGLASADIVWQAPAEGGIPRYMAIYQTSTAPAIGPIRSSRLYFIGWATEWRAVYVHVGGAPNALAFLRENTGRLIYNADQYVWGNAGYMWRITRRLAPHNVYSSGAKLEQLAARVKATAPQMSSPYTFEDDAVPALRPVSGSIVVPYLLNRIRYTYDPATNRYRRAVSGEKVQVDAGTKTVVAPANVIVLKMTVGPLVNAPGASNNQAKGRLELGYIGSGAALVFNNGGVVKARWSKASNAAPTLLAYASGPQAGQPVPLVRGQIFFQVVSTSTVITYAIGGVAATAEIGPRLV